MLKKDKPHKKKLKPPLKELWLRQWKSKELHTKKKKEELLKKDSKNNKKKSQGKLNSLLNKRRKKRQLS